jgi:hypothetical protein
VENVDAEYRHKQHDNTDDLKHGLIFLTLIRPYGLEMLNLAFAQTMECSAEVVLRREVQVKLSQDRLRGPIRRLWYGT